jgi:hypothetical protein
MLGNVEHVEFYYDSSCDDPKEDPQALQRRLERLAEEYDVTLSVRDTAGDTPEDRRQCLASLRGELPSEPGYTISRQTFMGNIFARHRPVLVIRYEDDPPLVYPHRNGAVADLPICIQDVLDALDPSETANRSDYEQVRTDLDDEGTTEPKSDTEGPASGMEKAIRSTIRQVLPVRGLQWNS